MLCSVMSDHVSLFCACVPFFSDLINVKVLTKLLQREGHTVAVAKNGKEAVDMYAANPAAYQLILMDLHMRQTHKHTAAPAASEEGDGAPEEGSSLAHVHA